MQLKIICSFLWQSLTCDNIMINHILKESETAKLLFIFFSVCRVVFKKYVFHHLCRGVKTKVLSRISEKHPFQCLNVIHSMRVDIAVYYIFQISQQYIRSLLCCLLVWC